MAKSVHTGWKWVTPGPCSRPMEWDIAARAYLARLGAAEYRAFLARKRRKSERYSPSEYHRDLIEFLNSGDEHGFKARKALNGQDCALGF